MPVRWAYCLIALQTASVATPKLSSVLFFQIRLKTKPPVTPEARSQVSTRALHQAGTGTVRSRPPLATQVCDDPVPLSPLNLLQAQGHGFRSSPAASDKQSDQRGVYTPSQGALRNGIQKILDLIT